jgi:recombination protein RecT
MSQQNYGAAETQQNQQVVQQKKFQEQTVDTVLSRVKEFQSAGMIRLPADYSPENALKSAWLILQGVKDTNKRPVLEVCTRDSIANSLFDMVVKGLNPVKKQCYFIAYGNTLSCDESYLGTIAIAKREAEVKDVIANCIYEGDTFKYSIDSRTGRKTIIEHLQEFDNINTEKLKGAYAIVEFNDGTFKTEIMTMAMIRKAWGQGAAKGNSPAHVNFPDQMAIKSVISRAVKIDIGSSDDSHLPDSVAEGVKTEVRDKANKTEIGFNDSPQPAKVVSSTIKEPVQAEPEPQPQIEEEGPGY